MTGSAASTSAARLSSGNCALPTWRYTSSSCGASSARILLGFHTYDAESERYVNWGAASSLCEGWGRGTISEDGRTLHLAGRAFDPRDPEGTELEWRWEWTKESGCRHVFRAYAKAGDGTEFLLEGSVYTRAEGC